jgi:hypothetical protein
MPAPAAEAAMNLRRERMMLVDFLLSAMMASAGCCRYSRQFFTRR